MLPSLWAAVAAERQAHIRVPIASGYMITRRRLSGLVNTLTGLTVQGRRAFWRSGAWPALWTDASAGSPPKFRALTRLTDANSDLGDACVPAETMAYGYRLVAAWYADATAVNDCRRLEYGQLLAVPGRALSDWSWIVGGFGDRVGINPVNDEAGIKRGRSQTSHTERGGARRDRLPDGCGPGGGWRLRFASPNPAR